MVIVVALLLAAQRLAELRLAERHVRRLRARGAVEHGAGHYPLMVLLHVAWFAAWLAEAGPLSPHWRLWLGLALGGQCLRWTSILTLGERWTTRVLVLPEEPPIRRGLYALVPHPNYVGVALELFAVPLLFGAWKTAMLFTLLNGMLMRLRLRVENRAVYGGSR